MENRNKLWEILVPKHSNEGREYPVGYHRLWDENIEQLAGGITILRTARGRWVNLRGEVFVEEMIPVRICCDEGTIDGIIDFTLDHYNQEAVFAYEVSSNVKVKQRRM